MVALRAILLLAILVLGDAAEARNLQVAGRAGYLSEWQITGSVGATEAGDQDALSGPVTLRHTGLCTVSGPVEKAGRIDVKFSGRFPRATVEISMSLPTGACLYRGRFAPKMSGAMDCPDAKGIPVELSLD